MASQILESLSDQRPGYVVSFSGGKDSTAMLLRLLEEGMMVDEITFFDTGWEFPQLLDHVHRVDDYIQKHFGRRIVVLHPEKSFNYWMFERPVIAKKGPDKGKVHRIGNGWPSPSRRWCTGQKVRGLIKYAKSRFGKNFYQYVGYAADEVKRTGCGTACAGEEKGESQRLYPLIFEWDMDEKDCLQYCYNKGFDWGGLYQIFNRVSCFCCPLQRVGELRNVRRHFPELWSKMLKWDAAIPVNRGFFDYRTVRHMDQRFAREESMLRYMGIKTEEVYQDARRT